MRELEFLPEWYPKVRRHRRRLALQAWITLILICGLGGWMLLVERNVHAREIELGSLRSDVTESEVEVERLKDLLKLQQQLGKQNEIFVKIGRPIESTRLLTTLEELMPKSMTLLDLTIDTEEQFASNNSLAARAAKEKQVQRKMRLRCHGVAPTDVDVGDFLAKLTARPLFTQVEMAYSHERLERGHVMREFEITFAMDVSEFGGR